MNISEGKYLAIIDAYNCLAERYMKLNTKFSILDKDLARISKEMTEVQRKTRDNEGNITTLLGKKYDK